MADSEQAVVADPFDAAWDAATAGETGASEAPVTDGGDAQPETPASPAEPAPQPRDEQGRFVSPPTETAEAPAQPAPADGTAPAPTAEAPTEPEEPAAAAPEAIEAQWEALPAVTFRAHGEDIPIPGSKLGPDGAFIPPDQLPLVTRLLSSGREYDRRAQDWQSQVKAADAKAANASTTATTVLQHLDALVESGQIHEWLADVERNWPILKAKAEKAGLERQLETGNEELARFRANEEAARMRPVMDTALKDAVLEFGRQQQLTDAELTDVYHALRAPHWEAVVFPRADQDMPQLGVQKGQRVINRGVIEDEVRRVAGLVKRVKATTPSPAGSPAVQAAATQNAKVAQAVATQQGKKPVPAVPATRGPAPGTAQRPTFKTREEVDAWFDRGGYNEVE